MPDPTPASATCDFGADYDMNSPELAARWDEVVPELHARCPVARSEVGEGYWVLNRHADVAAAAADWERFSNATGFMPDRPADMPYLYPEECDPPFHTAVRGAVQDFFRPKAVRAYEDEVRRHAEELVAALRAADEPEAVAGFANALPGRVFCESVAGMPVGDVEGLQREFDLAILGPVAGRGAALQRAFDYVEAYLRRREEEPRRDDVVQAILDLDADGVDWDAKVGILANLTLGGVGTTGFVIASAIQHLADRPEDRARLVADPALLPGAIEELIRFFAPSPHDGRRVTAPVEVGGVAFAPGDYVILSFGAASRDPAVFDRPDELVLDRPLPNRHMAFGSGLHRCVGLHLAKLELRVGLEVFLREVPDYALAPGFAPAYQISNTRVIERLPLVIR
jgi:cytochrome P450